MAAARLDEIPLRAVDFRTSQITDWLDGLPILGRAGRSGVVAGSANVGTGSLAVGDIAAHTRLGVHFCAITVVGAGLTRLTVTDPIGGVTAEGVVGTPVAAGGLTLTVAAGGTPFAVGDVFAVSVLPNPLDVTGFIFDLRVVVSAASATAVLAATTTPADGTVPTILSDGPNGALAMRVLQPAMARCAPGDYPYSLIARDPASGLRTPAFAGTLRHRAIPTLKD